jgi:hypothetical protein
MRHIILASLLFLSLGCQQLVDDTSNDTAETNLVEDSPMVEPVYLDCTCSSPSTCFGFVPTEILSASRWSDDITAQAYLNHQWVVFPFTTSQPVMLGDVEVVVVALQDVPSYVNECSIVVDL